MLKMRVEKRVPKAFVSILSICVCESNRTQSMRLIWNKLVSSTNVNVLVEVYFFLFWFILTYVMPINPNKHMRTLLESIDRS